MQPTTIRNAVLWVILASAACNKDNNNPDPSTPLADLETLNIPASFQQNILLNGFTATYCNVCPVLNETAARVYENFKGRMSVLLLHKDALGSPESDSVFRFFNITGMPAWFYFPVLPDSTTFLTMTQKFGIAIASAIRGDSGFVKVVTGFCDDVNTPVRIAVWLTEDSITGEQYSQSTSYYSDSSQPFYNLVSTMNNFQHNHVLRKVISGSIFGDLITSTRTITGVRDVRQYAFKIPKETRKEKLKVIAFAYTGVHLYGMVNNVNEVSLGDTVYWQ